MSVSSQVQGRLFQTFIYPGRAFANCGGLWSHWSAPRCECVRTHTHTVEHEHKLVKGMSGIKTVVADGILNQRLAGVKPTSFSDLSATSISVPRVQAWLIRAAGTPAHFPLFREHDALLGTNNAVLIDDFWHCGRSVSRIVLFQYFSNSVIKVFDSPGLEKWLKLMIWRKSYSSVQF